MQVCNYLWWFAWGNEPIYDGCLEEMQLFTMLFWRKCIYLWWLFLQKMAPVQRSCLLRSYDSIDSMPKDGNRMEETVYFLNGNLFRYRWVLANHYFDICWFHNLGFCFFLGIPSIHRHRRSDTPFGFFAHHAQRVQSTKSGPWKVTGMGTLCKNRRRKGYL